MTEQTNIYASFEALDAHKTEQAKIKAELQEFYAKNTMPYTVGNGDKILVMVTPLADTHKDNLIHNLKIASENRTIVSTWRVTATNEATGKNIADVLIFRTKEGERKHWHISVSWMLEKYQSLKGMPLQTFGLADLANTHVTRYTSNLKKRQAEAKKHKRTIDNTKYPLATAKALKLLESPSIKRTLSDLEQQWNEERERLALRMESTKGVKAYSDKTSKTDETSETNENNEE